MALNLNWEGVIYLLIQQGYNIILAINDAFDKKMFQLVLTLIFKIEDNTIIKVTNSLNQNLFHSLAINGKSCDSNELIDKIFKELKRIGINPNDIDNNGRNSLHYSCEKK